MPCSKTFDSREEGKLLEEEISDKELDNEERNYYIQDMKCSTPTSKLPHHITACRIPYPTPLRTIKAQINTLFVKQGTIFDRHLGPTFQILAASMLLSVPRYERRYVPFTRRKTVNPGGITLLQRLGIGFVIQIIAIAIAYAVEVKHMHVIRAHRTGPKETVHMSIFWPMPQYARLGIVNKSI
ncbi:hypothetical protein Acr_03g0012570 [Actinidia rufa]|uniref:Uncharacterized protein n=1 Tax=Actinidia rufa TaxID=165716 RepID=A0A7J0EDD5_9ERIC|nr:hypothetical protein Acr_03g0012570 [Actinidia rufa]